MAGWLTVYPAKSWDPRVRAHECTLVQMRGLGIVRPSVCPSVRPSVTLVICDHIGWKSWKLIARSISHNTFALCSQKAIHLIPGEHGEIWGRLDVG